MSSSERNAYTVKSTAKHPPYMTILLLAANIVTYFAIYLMDGNSISQILYTPVSSFSLYRYGGLIWENILYEGEYWRMITAAFLHVDIRHLFNNMLLLGFLGASIEKEYRSFRSLLIYIVSALAGSLLSVFYYQMTEAMVVSVGASGAVFGFAGACFWLILRQGGQYAGISASRMLLLIVYNLYAGFTQGTINNAAHIGGLVAGFLLMIPLSHIEKRPTP